MQKDLASGSKHPNAANFYAGKHQGSGSTDLWYPFGNGVMYFDGTAYSDPSQLSANKAH